MAPPQGPAGSATLQLGALAGLLAGVAVLLSTLPLSAQSATAQAALADRVALNAAVGAAAATPTNLHELRARFVGLSSLVVVGADGSTLFRDGPAQAPTLEALSVCATEPRMLRSGVACALRERDVVVVTVDERPTPDEYNGTLVFALSALVGILTAMGVITLLRPISRMRQALDRVRSGERGVRVDYTGMAELDELVSAINDAASAMEAREDAVLARIQVVQQLARLVAHEVRNPLQSLEMLTQLMVEEEVEAERAETAASIHAEIDALNAVVQRLLSKDATSGSLRLRRAPIQLETLMQHVARLRSTEASAKGAHIRIGAVTDRTISVDTALLGRSLENLVINALHMVPADYGLVELSAVDEGTQLVIRVDDNGTGVDPEYGQRIFEANVSTKATGTGLGLTLVRGVVEAHGGYVAYTDSPLGGARFLIYLPADEAPGAATSNPSR